MTDVTVRPSRGLDLLRVCPLCRQSNRRCVPLPPPSGLGAESGDETRGVGTIWSFRQPCREVSRLASTLGWPVREVVQPLRWWLSGDTDAIWHDRCGEDADRPFFHGLAVQLLADRFGDGSTPETLRPGPSSGVASCPSSGSEISGCVHPPALPLSARGLSVVCCSSSRLLGQFDSIPARGNVPTISRSDRNSVNTPQIPLCHPWGRDAVTWPSCPGARLYPHGRRTNRLITTAKKGEKGGRFTGGTFGRSDGRSRNSSLE